MNEDLLKLIQDFAIREHAEINQSLFGKSKEQLISMLTDLLTAYFNDLNSSTLRETVVVRLAGFQPTSEKLGYDGYRHDAASGKVEHCEVKPKNIQSATKAKSKPKLSGQGNFTDYTWKRFHKNLKDNPRMLVAGFIDGRLIYIFEFDFKEEDFTAKLRAVLARRFPNGENIEGEYLRSASFSFGNYANSTSLKTRCFATKEELEDFFSKGQITRQIFDHLISASSNN